MRQSRKEQCPVKLPDTIPKNIKSGLVEVPLYYHNCYIGQCAIVHDVAVQDTKNGIYWVRRELAQTIIAAVLSNKRRFTFRNEPYSINLKKVHRYRAFDKFEKKTSLFCEPEHPKTVYVYRHKSHAWFDSDNYETITAMVLCTDVDHPVPMTVIHSKQYDLYFINQESYQVYCAKYGLPFLRLKSWDSSGGGLDYEELSDASPLRLYGYNVGKQNGLNAGERRALLSKLIDSGLLYKADIIHHLEWLIHTRDGNPNMDDCCRAWRDDLEFVHQYRRDKERMVWANKVIAVP